MSMPIDISELPLVGGHAALDLVNTVSPRVPAGGGEPHEHLLDPAALLHWAGRTALVDGAEVGAVEQAWADRPGAGTASCWRPAAWSRWTRR
jgi:hypothetical protein